MVVVEEPDIITATPTTTTTATAAAAAVTSRISPSIADGAARMESNTGDDVEVGVGTEKEEDNDSRDRPNNNDRAKNTISSPLQPPIPIHNNNYNNNNKEIFNNKNSKNESPYPICWLEDEVTQQPLRWQYFAGVLFDSIHPRPQKQQQQQQRSGYHLPWRIRLHFQSYPTQRLLELDNTVGVVSTIERTFKNSLKQALVLQHGNNRVALNMTKHSHEGLWNAIRTANYKSYRPILEDVQVKEDSQISMIPIRLSIHPTQPMIQRRCDCHSHYTNSPVTMSAVTTGTIRPGNGNNKDLLEIVDGAGGEEVGDKGPPVGRTEKEKNNSDSSTMPTILTLGSLLCDWAPQYFETTTTTATVGGTTNENENNWSGLIGPTVRAKNPTTTSWRVAGIVPPLSTPLVLLWRLFCHPDNFLYISIVVPSQEGGEEDR
jgi:hypothetical protein